MSPRRVCTLALLALLVGAASANAVPAKPARRASAKPVAADTTASRRVPGARVAPRVLDDIRIEGEIPVPQVLFITARDQRRFMEFQHHRYARTSLELGRGTPTPARVVVTEPGPAERKEKQ